MRSSGRTLRLSGPMTARQPSYKRQTLVYLLLALLLGPLLIISLLLTKKRSIEGMSLVGTEGSLLLASESLSSSKTQTLLSQQQSSSRTLPSLRNGGVVVFFHNPKTGGTSIRDLMKTAEGIDFVTRQKVTIDQVYEYMDEWTTHTDSHEIHFLEIHGEPPGFIELLPKLQKWRQQADTHNVPIFIFTMMRDPLDWLLSCFNFFCLSPGLRRHTKCTSPSTIEGLLQESRPNPQSRWYCFMSTIMAVPNQVEPDMTTCTLQELQSLLSQHMDWVGFMERYDETLQVFQHVLPPNITSHFTTRNKTRRKQIKREMLNETTTQQLQKLMSQDYELYRGLQKEYRLEKMNLLNNREKEEAVQVQ